MSLRGEGALFERQPELLPNIDERLGQRIDEHVVMIGAWRDAQALRAFWHRRIVDRLDVDAVIGKKKIARLFAPFGIADENRNDMRGARHDRKRRRRQYRLGTGRAILVTVAFPL